MEYSLEFKNKVFQIFRWRKDLKKIINAIEKNNHNRVRLCIEDAIDDPSLYGGWEHGRRVVSPAKKNAYESIRDLYSEFMNAYVRYLDNANKNGEVLQGKGNI